MSTIKHHRYYKRMLMILFSILLIAGGIAGFITQRGNEGFFMDILSLLATLIGTVFIAVELRNSQIVTCCDLLIQLNNYFHDSASIMNVYETLEKEYAGDESPNLWNDVHDSDVAAYCTFFENIYLLVHNKIAKMENIDALFGYRFFLFVNNSRIQEKYILPTSSSYSEIFELYEVWQRYRKKHGKESMTVNSENGFTEEYLKDELYMCDRGYARRTVRKFVTEKSGEFVVKEAAFSDLSDITDLQGKITEQLENKEIYGSLTRAELIESLHLDSVYCIWNKDKLAAFTVLVANRKSDRNLYHHCKDVCDEYEEVYTFDAIAVDPAFRGDGIQNEMIRFAIETAKKSEQIKYVATTVSPDNTYSLRNFEKNDFDVHKTDLMLYGGLKRSLLLRKVH